MVLNTTFGLESLRQGLDRQFSAQPLLAPRYDFGAQANGQFVPRANCAETPELVLITVELPGVDPADMSLQVQGGYLVLAGLRRPVVNVAGRHVCFDQTEGRFGTFRWGCALPANVHPGHVRATMQNGLLYIEFSKRPDLDIQQAQGIQIAIHEGHKA